MSAPYQRKEIIGNATLYLGDCRDILPTLPKVDAVITDPPYEAEAHTAMRRTNKSIRSGASDVIDFDAIDENTRHLIARHSAENCRGWALFFCQVEAASVWRDAMVAAQAKYRRTMCWVKPDSSPQFNGQGPAQGYECISSSWCGDGASKWNAGGKRGVYVFNCNSDRWGGHPTEKPVPLMEAILDDFTNAGQTILDPIMGSGTTGVACMNLDRHFIGIEREPKYFDIACRRIEDALRQERLFA